jgi:PAS domain S-box-containing protein
MEMLERRQAEDRFFKTFTASPAAMSVTRFEDGLYRNVNPRFLELLGYDLGEVIGHTSLELNIYRNPQERAELLKLIRGNHGKWTYDTQLHNKAGQLHDVTISVVEVELEGEPHILSMILDMTERNQILSALRSNEQQLRTLFNVLPVGVSYMRPDGQIIQSNAMLEKILGVTREKMSAGSLPVRRYVHANGSPMAPTEFASARALKEQRIIQNVETGIVMEDGHVVWTSVSAAPVSTPEVGAVVITADITERKHIDDELRKSHKRYQMLSQRLVEIQEEERRTISRELHDRVGQSLAALNLNLSFLNTQFSEQTQNEQLRSRLKDAMQLTEETVSTIRDVMADLRPPALDDYGLEAALNAYASTFTRRSGIEVAPVRTGSPVPHVNRSIELTLLRITQEALTNVARHSHASRVFITLEMEGQSVHLLVEDNGDGILSWQKANRPGSHGLKIMRERAEAFGGHLQILSSHKKGTTIDVKIPLPYEDTPPIRGKED